MARKNVIDYSWAAKVVGDLLFLVFIVVNFRFSLGTGFSLLVL